MIEKEENVQIEVVVLEVEEVEEVEEEMTTMRGIHSERNLSHSEAEVVDSEGTAEEIGVESVEDRVASVTEVVLEALSVGVTLLKDKPGGVLPNQAPSNIFFKLFHANRSPGLRTLAHEFDRSPAGCPKSTRKRASGGSYTPFSDSTRDNKALL
jgi:hypothetical protein